MINYRKLLFYYNIASKRNARKSKFCISWFLFLLLILIHLLTPLTACGVGTDGDLIKWVKWENGTPIMGARVVIEYMDGIIYHDKVTGSDGSAYFPGVDPVEICIHVDIDDDAIWETYDEYAFIEAGELLNITNSYEPPPPTTPRVNQLHFY